MGGGGGSVTLSDPLKVVEERSVRIHHLASLLSQISLQVKISYQRVSYCTRKRPCFHIFPTVPNRFKYHNNACFRYIVFNYFSEVLNRFNTSQCMLQMYIVFIYFSAVPNRFRYHQNICFKDIVFLMFTEVIFTSCFKQCQIARSTSFSELSLQFQNIISNSVRMS